jgi:aldehyde:ferredoxin oxidoreductase
MEAEMSFLHTGKILEVDLTKRKTRVKPSAEYVDGFIGARGVNAAILYENVGPEVEPYDEGNILIFGMGPLTGTSCPASARTEVTAKSPITGGIGSSNVGGFWGAEAKWAGYDHIVIRGKSEKPVYIAIRNDVVEIKDAKGIWGKDTYATQDLIKKQLKDDKTEVICIGPAGEKMVSISCLMHRLGNAAARTGMGAVMGSKNLKAVAVRGTKKKMSLAKPKEYEELCDEALKALQAEWFTKEFSDWGFTRWVDFFGKKEYLAAGNYRNYSWDSWDKERKSSFTKLWENNRYKKYGCYGCPSPCMEHFKIRGVSETVISCCFYFMPWALKMTDMKGFVELGALCQKQGVDVNSFMNLMAWIMELYEKGIINEKDTDGMPMRWGDRESSVKMMDLIVSRKGIGDIIAEGTDAAARKLGTAARECLMHVNGNPTYTLNHQAYKTVGLSAAVGNRADVIRGLGMPDINQRCIQGYIDEGIDVELLQPYIDYYTKLAQDLTGLKGEHLILPNVYEGKAKIVEYYEDVIAISDLLGGCKFLGPWFDMPLTPERYAKIYSAGKGVEITPSDLFRMAKKVITLERAFNAREGRTRDDDTLPKRFFNDPAVDGEFTGEKMHRDKFEKVKDEYYALRGWDIKTGIPTRETLLGFELSGVAEDLRKRGKLSS